MKIKGCDSFGFGTNSRNFGAALMTTLSTYLTISKNLSKWQQITAKEPANALQTKYFQANIGKATTISSFVNNPRLFNYAMTAFGLGDMTYAKGMMTKVLQQGVTSSKALANTLNNPNILAFAKAFNFAANGTSTTSSSSLVSSVVSQYTENALETEQGQQDPGVQLALYFQQHAANITDMYSVLADKNLLTVVQTALGISPDTSAEPVDQQYALLTKAVNVADFKNPTKLQAFIARFSAMYDATNSSSASGSSTSGSSNNPVLLDAANNASGGIVSIDPGLLTQLGSGGLIL